MSELRRQLMMQQTDGGELPAYPITIDNEPDGNGGYIQYDREYMSLLCGIDIISMYHEASEEVTDYQGNKLPKACSYAFPKESSLSITLPVKPGPTYKRHCWLVYENSILVATTDGSVAYTYNFSSGSTGRCVILYTEANTNVVIDAANWLFTGVLQGWNWNGGGNYKQIHYSDSVSMLLPYSFYKNTLSGTLVIPSQISSISGSSASYLQKIIMKSSALSLLNSSSGGNQRSIFYSKSTNILIQDITLLDDALNSYYKHNGGLYAKTGTIWEFMGRTDNMAQVIIDDGCKTLGNFCTNTEAQYIIPDSITEIASTAFEGTRAVGLLDLSSLVLSNKTLTIYPASNGSQLTALKIPNDITTLGNNFARFSKITEFDMPASVTSIGSWSFSHINLGGATFVLYTHWTGTPPTFDSYSWFAKDYAGNHFSVDVHIPVGTTQAYTTAGWNVLNLIEDSNM